MKKLRKMPQDVLEGVLTRLGICPCPAGASQCVAVASHRRSGSHFQPLLALENENHVACVIVLENEFSPDADGWVRLSPYGRHPKQASRYNDRDELESHLYIQVLDNEAAQSMAAHFNSPVQRLKRVVSAVPVYRGHPDVTDFRGVATTSEPKVAVGAVSKLEARADGLYGQISVFASGQTAIANDGLKWMSPFWLVEATGQEGAAIVVKPTRLISVGLTKSPNILGGHALANQRQDAPPAASPQTETMKPQIIGLLAGLGIAIDNDANEGAILQKISGRITELNTKVTALENDKTTLAGKVTATESERDGFKSKLTKAESDLTAAQTALANERTDRIAAHVDLAIARGQVKVADRDARIAALGKSQDLAKDLTALANEASGHKTTGTGSTAAGQGERKASAAVRTPRETLMALANDKQYDGLSWDEKYRRVLAENPALAEDLKKATLAATA